jgi:hypothetical protein
MSKYDKDTVYLYGDNCECFGEIDRETLKREWDYFSKFPNIFAPRSLDEQPQPVAENKTVRTLKLV